MLTRNTNSCVCASFCPSSKLSLVSSLSSNSWEGWKHEKRFGAGSLPSQWQHWMNPRSCQDIRSSIIFAEGFWSSILVTSLCKCSFLECLLNLPRWSIMKMEKEHFETKLMVWIPKISANVSPKLTRCILRHSRLERRHLFGSLDVWVVWTEVLLFRLCSCQTMVS